MAHRRGAPKGLFLTNQTMLITSTATGASTKELMARMGHASARAALIYQHVSEERDVVLAEGLSAIVEQALRR